MRLRRHPDAEVRAAPLNAGAAVLEAAAPTGYAFSFVDAVGVIERRTFREIRHRSRQWTRLLYDRGLKAGDRVVVLAGADREWRPALLAVLQAGGVAVPCSASAPLAELRDVAEHVRATAIASARPRTELADVARAGVVSADGLDPRDAVRGAPPAHASRGGDRALAFCRGGAAAVDAVVHTHATLLAHAEAASERLRLGQAGRVWSSVPDGSAASVWLLLAAWRAGVELVTVEETLPPHEQLELLARLRPDAVWFSEEEYAALEDAAASATGAFAAGSVGRVLTTDRAAVAAGALARALGADAVAVGPFDATGVAAPSAAAPEAPVVPAEPSLAPSGVEDDRRDRTAPSEPGPRAEDEAITRQKHDDRRRALEAEADEERERRSAEEGARAERERERRRAEADARAEQERERERRRAEEEARAEQERERRRGEADARAEQERGRRRAEDDARAERERRREVERARRDEARRAKALEKEEKRRRAEDERRRADEERRQADEERRRVDEERRRADAERRRAGEEGRGTGAKRRRGEHRDPDAPAPEAPERLAPSILSQISAYGAAGRDDDSDEQRDTA